MYCKIIVSYQNNFTTSSVHHKGYTTLSSPQGIYNIEFSTAQAAQQQKNKKILNSTSCTTTESKEQQQYKILNITTKLSTTQLNNIIKKILNNTTKIPTC